VTFRRAGGAQRNPPSVSARDRRVTLRFTRPTLNAHSCGGARLNEAARFVFVDERSIADTTRMTVGHAHAVFQTMRLEGWRAALETAGVPRPPVAYGDWSARSGYELGSHLAADPEVTAIFAANDQMAIGVLRAFTEAGHDVPGHVSVVGFDDVPEAAYLSRSLTTVRQDLAHLATFGVGMLIDAIENPRRQDRRENVPVELMVRETTAAPPPGR